MTNDREREMAELAEETARAQGYFRGFDEATRILTEAQFARRDVLDVTGLTDAQLKNTLDRDLVRLHSEHNPGTGRRRMFTGGDILKIVVAHTMSAIGFPMRWSHLVADGIERRAVWRLIGAANEKDFALITYPMSNGDWARIPITAETTEKPKLPVAYQVIEVDRLIDETLAKLNALVADEPIPDFSIPDIVPEPSPYSPENDFFRMWGKDDQGRTIRVGLTFEESEELGRYEDQFMAGDRNYDGARYLELRQKHEAARLQRVSDEAPARARAFWEKTFPGVPLPDHLKEQGDK